MLKRYEKANIELQKFMQRSATHNSDKHFNREARIILDSIC